MNKYSIKNIKSFKEDTEIEIKPITIFVGKNSCGKSSLIRFPVVLAQSFLSDADTPILFFGKNIDYGSYEDVVFGHSKKGKMEFSVSYEIDLRRFYYPYGKERLPKNLNKPLVVDIRVSLIKYSKKMMINNCFIKINGKTAINISRSQKEKYNLAFHDFITGEKEIEFSTGHLVFHKFIPYLRAQLFFEQIVDYCYPDKNNIERNQSKKNIKKLGKNIYRIIDSNVKVDSENKEYTNLRNICILIELYSEIMMNIRMQAIQDASDTYYIGPFRENPSRVYRDVEYLVDSVGSRGEDVGSMLKNDYSHGKKIISKVSGWFEKSMNYRISLNDMGSGLYSIVAQKEDGTKDNLIDVGYGISQVLPIVVQLEKIRTTRKRNLYSNSEKNGSTFVIEQPEIHLHPGAQAELANLFVDIVSQNSNEKTVDVMVETHSEHFIRRLQSLVADKNVNISNDQIKIYYVDKINDEAFIKEMKLLKNGQFEEEWPSGFFDKAYELSMELVRNISNQRDI